MLILFQIAFICFPDGVDTFAIEYRISCAGTNCIMQFEIERELGERSDELKYCNLGLWAWDYGAQRGSEHAKYKYSYRLWGGRMKAPHVLVIEDLDFFHVYSFFVSANYVHEPAQVGLLNIK